MTELHNREADERDINPNELMGNVTKPRLGKLLALSLVVHIFLLAVLSIGFFMDIFHYKTLHVKAAKKQEYEIQRKAEEEKQNQILIKKAEEEAKKKKEAEKNAPPPPPPAPVAAPAALPPVASAKTEVPAKNANPDEIKTDPSKPTPKIVKELNAVSKDRPSFSDVNLDGELNPGASKKNNSK